MYKRIKCVPLHGMPRQRTVGLRCRAMAQDTAELNRNIKQYNRYCYSLLVWGSALQRLLLLIVPSFLPFIRCIFICSYNFGISCRYVQILFTIFRFCDSEKRVSFTTSVIVFKIPCCFALMHFFILNILQLLYV